MSGDRLVVRRRSLDRNVDDDPDSSNNQPGIFGIEIEATTEGIRPQYLAEEAQLT